MNFILDTDSYKLSHFLGYPKEATHVYSYAESRGGVYPATVFFGLQKFIRELARTRVSFDDVLEAEEFASAHGEPFNKNGWLRIVNAYGGRIPVRIKAVPEGTIVPTRNVLVTVENTDPTMPWLTSYIETALLRAVWYPVTVATRIHYMKQRIKPYYDRTSDLGISGFALLDFSARGTSSRETAEVGGMAHLLSFIGSDNIPAVLAAKRIYDEPMAAFSVAATEHSVMTSFGQENELESFEYLIDNMMPENGVLSVVSDTWNIFEACKKWVFLADRIRAKNGTLVVRPDSGAMRDVLPQVLLILEQGFGSDVNDKGFKVLRNVKVLQGDGINENTVTEPFQIAEEMGISADSIMTGSGGGLMQANIDRDTCKFAFKASNVTIDGRDIPIAKNPVTDPGKMSKMGRLILNKESGEFSTFQVGRYTVFEDELQLVYENGKTFNLENFATIRERLAAQ
jgi:nicotinamide phosphoribosyltransferase